MNERKKIIDIAYSQIGYVEGENNENKYGQWYGMNNEPWCDIFVSWCAFQSGISEDIIPKMAYVPDTANWFDERKRYKNSESWGGNYIPKPGDLILFDYDRTSISDHIGIIVSINNRTIHTVEGNKDNMVKECTYDLADRSIRAYCTPDYKEEAVRNKDIKKFINKDSDTPVFSDTYCDHMIGSLNPGEECECYEIFENRAVVFYKVDGSDKYKVGYTTYTEGVK